MRWSMKLVRVALAATMLGAMFVAVQPAPGAEAITGSDFNPGYIISDENFYDDSAMSEVQIQSFLDSKIGTCLNTLCLNVLRINTPTTTLSYGTCATYRGGANESAARMIFKVQQACAISAKVLLVTLQKEQGLVTSKAPTEAVLRKALGQGCPDTAQCDSAYYGFFLQVYSAARQFAWYGNPAGSHTSKKVGQQNAVQFHPNASCGSSQVLLQNRATAALYYYTPYQPNAAALANLAGIGNACSSYGNRNFWVYYTNWFGSTTIARLDGDDRFDASAAISSANFDPGVATVYVANGLNFPDALSGAPVAAKDGAPILLLTPTRIPASIEAELARLKPARIVVLGGVNSVSEQVAQWLNKFTTGGVSRLAGADRFDASAAISAKNFAVGATTVYVANGLNFPDALSGAPVAAKDGAPVLLVTPTLIPASIEAELARLKPGRIVVLGGVNSVSKEVAGWLQKFTTGTVTRLAGPDRFDASADISANNFAAPIETVYVANGLNFPDALSGAPVAALGSAPILLVTPTSIPPSIVAELKRLNPAQIIILGGVASVSNAVSVQLEGLER